MVILRIMCFFFNILVFSDVIGFKIYLFNFGEFLI